MARELKVTQLDGIVPEATDWLWDQRIPLGEITLLAGREGIGKSTIAYELAAQLSRGELKGDYFNSPLGTIVVATEDALERTIVPRLMAAKADLSKIADVKVSDVDEGYTDELTLPVDLELLGQLIEERDIGLIILDPLLSRLAGWMDTHKDADVRKALEPLVKLAHSYECSILGLIHVNKHSGTDALSRIMGSRAFSAVARSVLYVIEDPDDETVCVIGRPKSNLGGIAASQSYRIVTEIVGYDARKQKDVTAGRIEWGDFIDQSINALLKTTESKGPKGPKPTARDAAKEWLRNHLSDGAEMSALCKDDAKREGIAPATLQRAARELGIRVEGKGSFTSWRLPDEAPTVPDGLVSVDRD